MNIGYQDKIRKINYTSLFDFESCEQKTIGERTSQIVEIYNFF